MRTADASPRRPGPALCCLLPVPALGGAAGMWWWPESAAGYTLYAFSKVLLLALPLFWHWRVDGGAWRVNRCSRRGMAEGLASGLLMFAVIWAFGLLAANRLVDVGDLSARLAATGFHSLPFFLLAGLYWSTVNAVLEEMVWRWFVLRQIRGLSVAPRPAALLSAAAFTLHHLVVVRAWADWPETLLLNAGVFAAGWVWARLTLRHRSVLPACLSHILADLGLVSLGVYLFF